MKVVILSIVFLIAAAAASETPEVDVVCDVNDSLLPNPDDCSSFFACDNGVPRLTSCPPGLHFNPEVLVCDRPENVNCEGGSTSTPQPTTAAPTTSTVKPTTAEPTTTTTVKPTTAAPTTTTTVKPTTVEPTTTTIKPTTAEPTTTSRPNVTSTAAPSTTTSAPNATTSEPLTTTSLSPNVTSTPEPTTLPPSLSGCPANGSAIIANPSNCSSFLVCINGANTTVNCPPDMLFNPEVNACDLAANVDCQIVEPTTTEAPTTTTEQPTEASTDGTVTPTTGSPGNETTIGGPGNETTTASPGNGTTTGRPGNETTTEEPGYTPNCPEEGYVILENPESCGSFYVCVNGVSGLIECPVGNDFNPETNHCDLPADPNCRNPTEPPTTPDTYVPPCPANGTVQLPNPADCSSFYICINNNYAKLPCPENHSFNETLQKCTPGSCNANLSRSVYFECEEDGYFPNPEDCSSYYVCAGNQVFLQNCPDGLHFDVALGTCNTPAAANCQLDSTTGEPTTTDGTTVTSSPITTSGAPNATTTAQPSTPTQNPTDAPTTVPSTASPGNPGCPDDGVAILPDPDDCTKFIVCIDGEHDVVECPDGYGFNEELGTCDLAENVNCGTSPSEPDCPSSGTTTLPNPEDCESYYICIGGNAALIKCPAGFNFDKETGTCSADAECPLSTTSSPTATPTAGTTTTSAPTTASDTTPPSDGTTPTEGPTDSPTTSDGSVNCDGVEDGGLLPNPDSCTSFYQCANGIPLPIDCPPGLEFNADAQVCDNPETSGCSSKSRQLLNKILGLFQA